MVIIARLNIHRNVICRQKRLQSDSLMVCVVLLLRSPKYLRKKKRSAIEISRQEPDCGMGIQCAAPGRFVVSFRLKEHP